MFCAISSFVTMFSKRRLLQRRQKASIILPHIILLMSHLDLNGFLCAKDTDQSAHL